MDRELLREIGIVILVVLVLFSVAVVLFFAEGGEIYGFNHDPKNPPENQLVRGNIVFIPADKEITPIYDDKKIISVDL